MQDIVALVRIETQAVLEDGHGASDAAAETIMSACTNQMESNRFVA